MRILGLALVALFIGGAFVIVGPHIYLDGASLIVVFAGAAGYALLKGDSNAYITNFGAGAVYVGWVGTLIGLIAITRSDYWGDVAAMGPALGVSMLTVLYGYVLRLVTMAFEKVGVFEKADAGQ